MLLVGCRSFNLRRRYSFSKIWVLFPRPEKHLLVRLEGWGNVANVKVMVLRQEEGSIFHGILGRRVRSQAKNGWHDL